MFLISVFSPKSNLHSSNNQDTKDDRDILRDVAYKTTELHLVSDYTIECLLTIGHMGQVPDFPCLSKLRSFYFSYDSWKYVTSVLDKSPQLETIVFQEGLYHRCLFSKPPQNESLLPFSCNAKVIEVNDICGYDGSSLLLLGHLLKNARVLKKLIVRKCHGFDDMEEARQLSKDLLMLPRASSDCSMLVLNYKGVTSS
ncbi:putative F-box/LRR-repeat protein At5g15620 [Silene latifolia]|uniref:putative F-box/LRR-repeat protein At5g15620 n=1 Tax=Silene latifolia TaxID=37657 RepID=UPI003D76B6A3